jgi:predicted transcriptional regulator
MEKQNVTVRLETDTIAFLDQIAESQDRDRAWLMKRAIDDYVAHERWRIEDIRKAIAEADAGDFASDKEVAAIFGTTA